MEYQLYDSSQALCSYFRSVLCTKALLSGAGVGSADASALAAALTWVLRDGVGMIGSVSFASIFADQFGAYVKEWRLFADIINDVALTLDMVSSLFPKSFYLPIISTSAVCKAMCGISAGATKLCITNHLSIAMNAGDLAAKENTQETFITLIGLLLGYTFARGINDSIAVSWILFFVFTLLHIFANYKAVSCLKLTFLNRPRIWLLTKQYTVSTQNPKIIPSYETMSIKYINSLENIYFSIMLSIRGPSIGGSLREALKYIPVPTRSHITPYDHWMKLHELFASEEYVILPQKPTWKNGYKLLVVLLSEDATPVTFNIQMIFLSYIISYYVQFYFYHIINICKMQLIELKAYVHASYLHQLHSGGNIIDSLWNLYQYNTSTLLYFLECIEYCSCTIVLHYLTTFRI